MGGIAHIASEQPPQLLGRGLAVEVAGGMLPQHGIAVGIRLPEYEGLSEPAGGLQPARAVILVDGLGVGIALRVGDQAGMDAPRIILGRVVFAGPEVVVQFRGGRIGIVIEVARVGVSPEAVQYRLEAQRGARVRNGKYRDGRASLMVVEGLGGDHRGVRVDLRLGLAGLQQGVVIGDHLLALALLGKGGGGAPVGPLPSRGGVVASEARGQCQPRGARIGIGLQQCLPARPARAAGGILRCSAPPRVRGTGARPLPGRQPPVRSAACR